MPRWLSEQRLFPFLLYKWTRDASLNSWGMLSWCSMILKVMFKKGGPKLITKLTELFNIMLHQESIPQEFKDVSLVNNIKEQWSVIMIVTVSCSTCVPNL